MLGFLKDIFKLPEPQFRIIECADKLFRVQVSQPIYYENKSSIVTGCGWHTIPLSFSDTFKYHRRYAVFERLPDAEEFKNMRQNELKNERIQERLASTITNVY